MERQLFIDRLRVFLCISVILHHVAIAYGALGGWFYLSPNPVDSVWRSALTVALAVNQAYFMALFFFLSAYFTPGSLARKGFIRFVKDRLLRLGVPLAAYVWFGHPLLVWVILRHKGETALTASGFVFESWQRAPETGHMWFVATLLIFDCAVAIFHRLLFRIRDSRTLSPIQVPLWLIPLATALAFTLRQFYAIGESVFGLQLGYFGLYVCLYGLGLFAARYRWIERLTWKENLPLLLIGAFALPMIILPVVLIVSQGGSLAPYIGGWHLEALGLAAWEACVCFAVSVALLLTFRAHFNRQHPGLDRICALSYGAYVVHPLWVVLATMALENTSHGPVLNLGITALVSTALSFATAALVRTIPGMTKIL
ncbi:MAG: acyltransferase [Opitutaceae bacterium]|nr:acyltransferase [Opitutaceae bacterium]